MKHSFLLIIFSLLFVFGVIAQKKDWAGINRFAHENELLQKQVNDGKRVVFLGNSITEGWIKIHPEFFKENNYISRGISGQTTYQMLVRFREDVINLKPKVLVLLAGTNDIAENTCRYDEERTFGNIISMVELAKANKIKVILSSILPAASFPWIKEIIDAPSKIISLNSRIKEYAKKCRIPYVDYYSFLVNDRLEFIPEYAIDGVHPKKEGYLIMESLIKPVIDKKR